MAGIRSLARRLGGAAWFANTGRILVPADRLVGRLTGGRVVALGIVPSLLLTTTGRRSGQLRTQPLLFVPDGDGWVVTGSNWGQTHQPAWALNLLANPRATVTVKGRRIPVEAHLATGPERERLWRLVTTEWPPYEAYVKRAGGREIHVFRLAPRTS
ncbi:nitroreductase/quinone reductase family protein [Micromonospora sp. CPCC 206061]|uniref:nitroreductase/quinone reductase family protein n=1 Tax=Micromonospora sp. CPCC 206061 TaxID=3122410 RepID=UPI002FEF2C80